MASLVGQGGSEQGASVKAVWSPRAIRHLVALREYIASDSEQNAALVAQRILKSVDLLQTQPDMGRPGRLVGTRELVVPGTPYIVPYRVRSGRLELIAVFHGRRRWPRRLVMRTGHVNTT